jgi:hypothetical protein
VNGNKPADGVERKIVGKSVRLLQTVEARFEKFCEEQGIELAMVAYVKAARIEPEMRKAA